mmetsp:Transcript_999/g.1855  ORF Transcript_999/g.1855 Transcript_999/m.1855 type:complete len:321 (-) Transcript_999:275-1237(-)
MRVGEGDVRDQVEELFEGGNRDTQLAKVLEHVVGVGAEEVEGVRVVVLDGLRHVDEVDAALVVQHVVFGEVAVDEAGLVEHVAHHTAALDEAALSVLAAQLCILQPRRRPAILAEERHDKHVAAQRHRLWTPNTNVVQPDEVLHLLLGPQADHLARVVLRVAAAEAEVAGDVLVAVLEHQDGRLVHLDGILGPRARHPVVHIRLFAGADRAVDVVDGAAMQHFEDNHARAWIHHLLHSRPIRAVSVPTPRVVIYAQNVFHSFLQGVGDCVEMYSAIKRVGQTTVRKNSSLRTAVFISGSHAAAAALCVCMRSVQFFCDVP